MKVFISSVVKGMEEYREAAAKAARILKHEVLRSEDFGAAPGTPQQVCLAGVRAADVVVLLLGKRYGAAQASGLSPTHEEFREAKERCPVLVFVERDVGREERQDEFLRDVQAWGSGHYTAAFSTAEELHAAVLSGLHQLELARKTGPVDGAEMLSRAKEALPTCGGRFGQATLGLVVVGAPAQQILRPVELEDPALGRELTQEALFGGKAIFRTESGTDRQIEGNTLQLSQDDRSIGIDQVGTVVIQLPAQEEREGRSELPVLLEEFVQSQIQAGLAYAGWLLERVDPTHRLQEVAPVISLSQAGYLGWRTRDEHKRSPNSVSLGVGGRDDIVVHLRPVNRRREVLNVEARKIAEDFTVLLRRERRS
jgi:hypothetical protein